MIIVTDPRDADALRAALTCLEQIAKRSIDRSSRAFAEGAAEDLRAYVPAEVLNPESPLPTPLDTLIATVRAAIHVYDASGDHRHAGSPRPGDCLRCTLRPFEQRL